MATRTQQPHTPRRRTASLGGATTFHVDRYELGFDVPLAHRHVTVELARREQGSSVALWNSREEWAFELSEDGVVQKSGQNVLRWIGVVLDHVGVV